MAVVEKCYGSSFVTLCCFLHRDARRGLCDCAAHRAIAGASATAKIYRKTGGRRRKELDRQLRDARRFRAIGRNRGGQWRTPGTDTATRGAARHSARIFPRRGVVESTLRRGRFRSYLTDG